MKKIIFLILIFTLITSPASASEVIDVFEEYASVNDFVCKTYSFSLPVEKNKDTTGSFFVQCAVPYSVYVSSPPTNGTLSLNDNRQFSYKPNKDFIGSDSFQYRIFANGVFSNISECNISISSENTKKISETDFFYEDMKNHPAETAALKLVEKNIIKGERVSDKYYFYPDLPVSRGLAISYISAALDTDISTDNGVPIIFADNITLCDQLQKDSYICHSAGIVTGKSVGDKIYLSPNEPLTRAEMFSMIDRAISGKTNSDTKLEYPDANSIPDYAKISVKNLIANDFIKNSQTELLRPNETATKAEFSILLYKMISLNEESATKTLSQRIKEGFYTNLIT